MIDEHGKVPLNLMDESQLTALLEYAGLTGEALTVAHDSFLDWLDDDDEARANGAEAGYYVSHGVRVRNGNLQSIGELRQVRGFTPAVVARIAAIASVDFGSGPFDPRFAQPAAIGIMYPDSAGGPQAIEREREAAGQVTALSFVSDVDLAGRPLTIDVMATRSGGVATHQRCVIELTGAPQRPYVIRDCE